MNRAGFAPAVIAGALRTYALGGLGGVVFYALNMPAPFMLGSVLFCWVIGGVFKPVSRALDPAPEIRKFALAAVAVILGSYVSPGIVREIPSWWPTLLLLAVVSLVMTWTSYGFLRYLRGYDRATAWFSSQPAGLSEVIAISRDYTDKDYIVALIHLIRVSTVFILSPIVVWLTVDDFNGRAVPGGQVHIWETSLISWVQLVVLAAVGVLGAKLLRLPMIWLLGPMLLSAVWGGFGVLPFERPFEGVALLQVVLGSSIGARMAQVSFRELGRFVPDAYVVAIWMISLAAGSAMLMALFSDQPFARTFFSISAGGASELSLLAVAMGYEVAFVTMHHLFRMGFVLGLMPLGNPPKPDKSPS